MTAPRITIESLKILREILNAEGELSGTDIRQRTGLLGGTVYRTLRRLDSVGVIWSRWESGDPSELGRPLRRYYALTPDGHTRASAELSAFWGSAQ